MQVKCTNCNGTGIMEEESVEEAVEKYYKRALEELSDPREEWEIARAIVISYKNPVGLRAVKNLLIEKLKANNKIKGASFNQQQRGYNGSYYVQTVYLQLLETEVR